MMGVTRGCEVAVNDGVVTSPRLKKSDESCGMSLVDALLEPVSEDDEDDILAGIIRWNPWRRDERV